MTTQPSNTTAFHESIVIVHDTGIHGSSPRFRCLFVDQKQQSLIEAVEVLDEAALVSLLGTRSPERIVAILPGSATICRSSILPNIEDDQLEEALRLQAEARLLGGTPPHRRAVAALECAQGESNRIGLIIAWPEETQADIPDVLLDASFIPETGAIAALFNGCRPTSPIVVGDTSNGSVSLALTCPQGIAFRSTRENTSSPEVFRKGTLRAIEETASLHNHTKAYTQSLLETLTHTLQQHEVNQPMILIPDEVCVAAATRMRGVPEEATWWGKWGLALGAALAVTGTLAPLATMRFEAPAFNPSRIQRFTARISTPGTALQLGVAAVLLLAIGPAFFAGVRLALLEFLNPNIATQYEEIVSARKKQVVYEELSKSAWPMSKLIGDALNCTPAGMEIQSMRLDVGEPISIRGRVIDTDGHSAAELIAIMEDKLQSYRVFRDIKFSYDPAGTYGDREFDISAVVMNPLQRPRYAKEDDFGTWTLAMRRDGVDPDDATESSEDDATYIEDESGVSMLGGADVDSIPSPDVPSYVGNNEPRDERTSRRFNEGGSDAGSRSNDRAGGSVSSRLPEPLTAEQINVMTLTEAKIALKDVSQGLSRVGSDTEAKQRLRNEMRMLLDRMKKVQQ